MATAEIVKPDVKTIETGLSSLRDRANAIVVRNQDEYVQACQIALDGRAYIKDVKRKLEPGIDSAKEHLNFLRNDMARYIEPANLIVETAAKKAEAWKAEERRKAEAEERRINEERRREAERVAAEERRAAEARAEQLRKEQEAEIERARAAGEIKKREANRLAKEAAAAAELARQQAAEAEKIAAATVHEVSVAPAVPKVAGIKARVNWKFRVIDPSKVKRPYTKPDEVLIGQDVRSLKDKAAAEALIGGIEVWSEDGI